MTTKEHEILSDILREGALLDGLVYEVDRSIKLQEEVCGLVLYEQQSLEGGVLHCKIMPIGNEARRRRRRFAFHYNQAVRAIPKGYGPLCTYHTHLTQSARLSALDMQVITDTGLDMIVLSCRDRELRYWQFKNQAFPLFFAATF